MRRSHPIPRAAQPQWLMTDSGHDFVGCGQRHRDCCFIIRTATFVFSEVLMARITLIETENAPPEVKEIYEKALRGKPGNAQKALAHRPEMLKNFLPFYASVGRSLDRKLYEMIYLRVSFINGCHYCQQHHLASSKRVGLTPEDGKALKEGNYARFTEKEQTALAYAEKLTRASREIADADFEKLKKHFSDAEIVDLHLLVGLANLTNRFTDPLGLEVEFPEEKL
jgi:uncharacterized peroxidase-related enzyme